MKRTTFLFSVVVAVASLVGSPAAKALVTLGSTFTFDLVGANTGGGGFYLAGPATATFGVSSTVTGVDGQIITISSSENIGVTTTTDMFTLSTPTNFLNEATLSGTTINALQFDIGDANSGSPAVSVVTPIGMYTAVGTFTDGIGATVTTAAINPAGVNTFLATNGLSYGAAEGVNTGSFTVPINTYNVHAFTYSITYNNLAPEPGTWAILALGIAAGVVMVIRRRRKAA